MLGDERLAAARRQWQGASALTTGAIRFRRNGVVALNRGFDLGLNRGQLALVLVDFLRVACAAGFGQILLLLLQPLQLLFRRHRLESAAARLDTATGLVLQMQTAGIGGGHADRKSVV